MLLLHLVGVYIIYINDEQWNKYQMFLLFNPGRKLAVNSFT
jgi:hypothetical protein